MGSLHFECIEYGKLKWVTIRNTEGRASHKKTRVERKEKIKNPSFTSEYSFSSLRYPLCRIPFLHVTSANLNSPNFVHSARYRLVASPPLIESPLLNFVLLQIAYVLPKYSFDVFLVVAELFLAALFPSN